MVFTLALTACGGGGGGASTGSDVPTDSSGGTSSTASNDTVGKQTINLWSFTDEVPNMVEKYIELNPEFAEKYEVNVTTIATTEGAYQPALDQALVSGGKDAPDMFAAEAAFVLKYTQGDMAGFAATYKDLGIDVDNLINEAEIAQYTVDIGSRNDEVVGLGFQATGGAVIYRRSLAMDVWGTDDPAEVAKKIGPGWDQFMTAAAEMDASGYSMVSGAGDIWQAIRNTGDSPWIVDETLYIDPVREAHFEYTKMLYENGWMNDTTAWQDAWFADMAGIGEREVFAFLGPAWLINYVMESNVGGSALGEGTYGDWAVAIPPVGFFWGGTWVLANKDTQVTEGVAELIEWITLDSSQDGLQYKWANGTLFGSDGTKDTVSSGRVMSISDGAVSLLGEQNMFDVFVPAGEYASGTILTQYDETINNWFHDQAMEYARGNKSRDAAIRDFKQQVADNLAVNVDF